MPAVRALTLPALLIAAGAAAQEHGPGFTLFQPSCRTCHVMEEGDNRLGPTLAGVVGSKAGAVAGFAYSDVMAQSTVVWDDSTLDAFLADPGGFMPGNRMLYPGMQSAEDRAAVIAYMAGGG